MRKPSLELTDSKWSPEEPALSLSKGTTETPFADISEYLAIKEFSITLQGSADLVDLSVVPTGLCQWYRHTQDYVLGLSSNVPFDKLRAGSSGLHLIRPVVT